MIEIQDIFINLFDLSIVNIDIRYLWNVYVLKMNNLISFELILGNNVLNEDGLILLNEGLKNLNELRWVIFDLVGNEVASINFGKISNNL